MVASAFKRLVEAAIGWSLNRVFGSRSSETSEQIRLAGLASLARHRAGEIVAAIQIDEWSVVGERTDRAGHKRQDNKAPFGSIGSVRTSFTWRYLLEPGVSAPDAITLAATVLESRGATQDTFGRYHVSARGDRLVIGLTPDPDNDRMVVHTTRVSGQSVPGERAADTDG